MKLLLPLGLLISVLGNVALADFDAGVTAYESGNLPQAAREFRKSAEAGDSNSQFNLALMYEQGIGVGKDEKAAVDWYRKSAAQGNSNAQYNLAVLYENGRGTAVDFAEANQWYRKAALQGDGLAVGNLGMLYMRGQGVNADKVAGLALLLVSVTLDPSPANNARQNISLTRGLTSDAAEAAQALAAQMQDASNVLVPLDQYLKDARPVPVED